MINCSKKTHCPSLTLKGLCLPGRKTKFVKLISWNRNKEAGDKSWQWFCSRWGFPLHPAPAKISSESRKTMTPKHGGCCFCSGWNPLTVAWQSPGEGQEPRELFLEFRVSPRCVGVCLASVLWHESLPDGILAFRCGVRSFTLLCALISRSSGSKLLRGT